MKRVPSVSVILVRPLALALSSSAAGLARVSPSQLCVGWAAAIRLTGDPTLALRIAEATPAGAFGIVEYICRSAPTLGDALTQWCRYLRILDDAVNVGLVDLGASTALRVIEESEAPAPASHELCFALVVRHARTMLQGDLRVKEVAYAHDATAAQAARHRAFFDAPVRFGAEHTELVLSTDTLAAPLVTADPILRPSAEEALAREAVTAPLTDQVRRSLRTALRDDDAQLEAVAKRLGVTGRTLQRRLKDEGTVFQTLRDELRKDLADRYLGQGMSFAEISFLLGFSEPSAFFRAFKRWTGLTPFERRLELSGA